MYSAYDAPLNEKIAALLQHFGYVSVFIILIVGIYCIMKRRNVTLFLSLAVMIATEIFLFWQTQSMGVHHSMIINIPIYILFIMILDFWEDYVSEGNEAKVKKTFLLVPVAACLLLMLLNFAKAFVTVLPTNGTGTIYSNRYYPQKRNDIETLNLLVNELNEMTAGTEDYIYVAASGQEVVKYLAENVQDQGSFIGEHFILAEQMELDNGVLAKIYVKTSEFSETDLQMLRDYYTALYPGYESIFAERIY